MTCTIYADEWKTLIEDAVPELKNHPDLVARAVIFYKAYGPDLKAAAAAEFHNTTTGSLASLRRDKKGPPYIKAAGLGIHYPLLDQVRYRLDAYVKAAA